MKGKLKEEVSKLVADHVSSQEVEELIHFLRQKMADSLDYDEDFFFKDLAHEMSGQVKELAQLLIDFKKDLGSKLHPELNEIATNYIPLATDQLAAIIEATELAANKIMDNLESMQEGADRAKEMIASLKKGEVTLPGGEKGGVEVDTDRETVKTLSPLIDTLDAYIDENISLISDSFAQMSFQDLTGQRIKRIMDVIGQMEEKVKDMVISSGVKLTEKEKNPGISNDELRRVVDEKTSELSGPQREGRGLDQSGIDDLLAGL